MKLSALLLVLSVLSVPASGLAQPIRDVPGTEPAPVPTGPAPRPENGAAPPQETQLSRERAGDGNFNPPRDRSGGATDAGPVTSTPYSGVPERGDPATGASGLGR